jgi:ubiquinone/menaquinone biosynthesis C-methylase UbiE
VPEDVTFRTDLYRGTAPYYDRYRPPYPDVLLTDLCQRVSPSGTGRLLDVACGTGHVALPLAGRFGDVLALDQEAESVAYAEAKAQALGVSNIRWMVGSAEATPIEGPFELITVGTAFHRLQRQRVAQRMARWLEPGGWVALLWSDIPWNGELPWQRELAAVFVDWMENERVPEGWDIRMQEPDEQILQRAGFDHVGRHEFSVDLVWTIETLTGFLYSTSFLNVVSLGPRRPEFERDLSERLAPHASDGHFLESASYAYELATRA